MKDDVKETIWKLARTGMTDRRIAEVVYYSPEYVKAIRLEAGILRPKVGPVKYPIEDIKRMITEGLEAKEIAKEMGCSLSLVTYYMRAMRNEEEHRKGIQE